jgi:hypothetical protein
MGAASEPAKPGSKLAAQLALGRRGGIRSADRDAPAIAPSAPSPPQPPDQPPLRRKAITVEKVKKRSLAQVKPRQGLPTAKAEAKAALAEGEARAKTIKDDQPWKAMGVSRATYFNRKKAGALP